MYSRSIIATVVAAALTLVAACEGPTRPSARESPEGAAVEPRCASEALPSGFASHTAHVNGTTLHYVTGGEGMGLILIHGFPENWSAWAEIMPRLAARFRVVAVDLRGIGGSTPTETGYDAATMAEDVYELAGTLDLDQPYVVGGDFGGWVAYALARLHPDAVRGAMIIDVPIAGVEPWNEIKVSPELWHFGFHQAPGLAEKLLAGRESIYIEYFLRSAVADPSSISDEDLERYACAYAKPGRMAAAMGMYRAFPENEKFGQERRAPMDVPIVLVAGGKSFAGVLPAMAKGLEAAGARSLAVETIPDSGHYPADESPAELAALIERHAPQLAR